MKRTIVTVTLFTVFFMTAACVSGPAVRPEQDNIAVRVPEAQTNVKKPVLGILPFYGGGTGEGETIANLFLHQPALLESFNVVTRSSAALETILSENRLQLTGSTDSDAIAGLGRILEADYVLSGSVSRLGNQNLLIATIVNVNTFEQVAGAYRTYNNLGEAPEFLPLLSRSMVDSISGRGDVMRETLSIVPFSHHAGISPHDSRTLTEILAIELVNTGKYAILPRTSTIQAARTEQGFQEDSGVAALGRAANANLVLSGNIGSLGEVNIFIAQILRVADGTVVIGNSRNYRVITDGINIMPEKAILLTEPDNNRAQALIAEHQQNIRTRQEAERRAAEAAAAEIRRAQDAEKRAQEAIAAEIRREQEALAAEIRREQEEEARKAQRAVAVETRKKNAVGRELEFFNFSYLMEGENTGFYFGALISEANWSPFPFGVFGFEPGVSMLTKGNFFSPAVQSDFNWYFNISPNIGVLFPISKGARLFANAVLEVGSLPGEGIIADWEITDKFGIGITPGFNAGISLGRSGIFNVKYRGIFYKDKNPSSDKKVSLSNAIGVGFGKRYHKK